MEIVNFARENGMMGVSEAEVYELVKFFDSNDNRKLCYSEFQQMLLPCEDNTLRRIVLDRPAFRCGRYDYLPRDIERSFTDIID